MVPVIAVLLSLYLSSNSINIQVAQDVGQDIPEYVVALEESRKNKKPILLLFTVNTCINGYNTNKLIEQSPEIQQILEDKYIFVELMFTKETVDEYSTFEQSKFGNNGQPFFVITNSSEKIIDTAYYIEQESDLIDFLLEGLKR